MEYLCIGIDGGTKSILDKTMVTFLLELFRLFGYTRRHFLVNLSRTPNLYNPRFSLSLISVSRNLHIYIYIINIYIYYAHIRTETTVSVYRKREMDLTF